MSKEIIKVLDALSDKFGVVIDWTKDSVMPYVEELFVKLQRYLLVRDIAGFTLSIAGIILSVFIVKKLIKREGEGDIDNLSYSEFASMVMTLTFVIFIFCIAGLFVSSSNLIQSITFPELRILRYLQNLIPE